MVRRTLLIGLSLLSLMVTGNAAAQSLPSGYLEKAKSLGAVAGPLLNGAPDQTGSRNCASSSRVSSMCCIVSWPAWRASPSAQTS